MVGPEGSAIAPLRVTNAIALSYRHPAVAADALPLALEHLPKPRNNGRGLRLCLAARHVIIRESTIKWILLREEPRRTISAAGSRIWIVEAAKTKRPIRIP